jgi:hypothetical protein
MNNTLGLSESEMLDSLNPVSDGVTADNLRKFEQTFTHSVENEDSAVTEVSISLNAIGNLQSTTTVKNIMGIDVLSSNVVGLVGEPFEINTDSKFDETVLPCKIKMTATGDIDFNDLIFLRYDTENFNYIELDTVCDSANSTVSTAVTHFSSYMVVDSKAWFEAWRIDVSPPSFAVRNICRIQGDINEDTD